MYNKTAPPPPFFVTFGEGGGTKESCIASLSAVKTFDYSKYFFRTFPLSFFECNYLFPKFAVPVPGKKSHQRACSHAVCTLYTSFLVCCAEYVHIFF